MMGEQYALWYEDVLVMMNRESVDIQTSRLLRLYWASGHSSKKAASEILKLEKKQNESV